MQAITPPPYIDFRGETDLDERLVMPALTHCDEDTRIRVYCTQLMNEVLENIHSKNDMLFHASLFYKIGDTLADKFPHRSEELVDASLVFWGRVQTRIKKMK